MPLRWLLQSRSQPASQTITAGQTATFSVASTGTAPLSYQWSKNGSAISGATSSSYTTPATTTSDTSATFSVTVSNSAGNAISSNATLTVNAPTTTYTLSATPSALSFSAQMGGATPALQNVTIDDTTPGPLPFTLSADQSWITLSATSGTTKATMQLGVNVSGLATGNYSGHVFVTASGVANSPLSIPVGLTVAAAGTATMTANPSSLIFGSINLGSNSTLP